MKTDVIRFTGEITKSTGVKCSFCDGEFEPNAFVREHRRGHDKLYRFCEECYDKILDEVKTNYELDLFLFHWNRTKKRMSLTDFIYKYNRLREEKDVVLR